MQWILLSHSEIEDNHKLIGEVAKLSPIGVVHHGGSGATSAGLRAGVPSIVVAFMADQPFWGRRIFELGCGPRPIRRKALTTDRLAAAIEQAVTDRVMQQRAAEIGQRIRSEDGIVRAVQLIEKIAAESK